jgi:pilus assembly protein Flp/PilA
VVEKPTSLWLLNFRKVLIMRSLVKFLKDDSGASAAEYAVLLTLITVVLIAAVQTLGSAISSVFANVSSTLSAAA